MRQLVLSLIIVLGTGFAASAQDSPGTLRGVYGPADSGIGQPSVRQRSAGGGLGSSTAAGLGSAPLAGVYGPGESGLLQTPALPPASGIYGPGESGVPAPTTTSTPSSGYSDNGPAVLVPGAAGLGQRLPYGVTASPMDDRPGYGTAVVNGRRAIINQSTNQIVQFLD
jgi:hypothetical protein